MTPSRRLAVLGAGEGWHTDDLRRAAAERGAGADVLAVDDLELRAGGEGTRWLAAGTPLESYDGVLVRIVPRGSLEQVVYRMDLLQQLEAAGIPVLNPPKAIERTVDKSLATGLLEQAGLPTPRTTVTESFDRAMEAFRELGDVIVKPLFGSNGRGMVRVTDEEIAYRVFRAIQLERGVFYLQETIAHPGSDVRAFVLGGRVVGCIRRRAAGWRTNLARGASAEPFDLPEEWERLALGAAAALGVEYAGVDLLPDETGRVWVLEVNGIPGWRGLRGATGVDVAGLLVDRLLGR